MIIGEANSEDPKDESVIPTGLYCYSHTGKPNQYGFPERKICPYWGKDLSKPKHGNGFCTFLGMNDWDENKGTSLLWDQVKECGINENLEDIIRDIRAKSNGGI